MEDHITKEASVESGKIIANHQVLVNYQIMVLVITINRLLAEIQEEYTSELWKEQAHMSY